MMGILLAPLFFANAVKEDDVPPTIVERYDVISVLLLVTVDSVLIPTVLLLLLKLPPPNAKT